MTKERKKSMEQMLEDLLQQKRREQGRKRKRLSMTTLEQELIEYSGGETVYQRAGGYPAFFQAVMASVEKELLEKMTKKTAPNGRIPSLPEKMWLNGLHVAPSWSKEQMMRVKDCLNMTYYEKHPECQTSEEWKRLEVLHHFLTCAKDRVWVGLEERSYALFGDEKFLIRTEGRKLLQRTGVTYEDLKVLQRGEPFQFTDYRFNRRGRDENHSTNQRVREVLIIENLNLYHTVNRLIAQGISLLGTFPDIVIYGKGRHIMKSIHFFYDFFDATESYNVAYVGDIDASGFDIYQGVKRQGVLSNIHLALPVYEHMRKHGHSRVSYENQSSAPGVLENVMGEMCRANYLDLAEVVVDCWEKQERIPQEALNMEILLKEGEGCK